MDKVFNTYDDSTSTIDKNNIKSYKIIIDTNILLNMYRYSSDTANNIMDAFETLKDNIWIPFLVGLEFNDNREKVILQQISIFEETEKCLNTNFQDLKSKINKLNINNRHPSIITSDISNSYKEFVNTEKDKITNLKEEYLKGIKDEPIGKRINNLFIKQVGKPYPSQLDIKKYNNEANIRYKNKIPPGYEDDKKDGFMFFNGITYTKKYSDYIIWQEIIEKVKDEKIQNLIFITDDLKEDWFRQKTIIGKKRLRNELINEIKYKTELKIIEHMTSKDFLEFIDKEQINKIEVNTFQELEDEESFRSRKNEKFYTPYVLVVCEEEVAVFDRGYNLISESASKELIDFAIKFNVKHDNYFSFNFAHQQPFWMTDDKKSKCNSYWLWQYDIPDTLPLI